MQFFAPTSTPTSTPAANPLRAAFPWATLSGAATRLLTRPVVESKSLKRIFVIGCPRSGTTIVQAALTERANLLTLPETYFFGRLFGALDDWMNTDVALRKRRWQRRLLWARAKTDRALQGALTGPLEGRRLSRHLSGRGYVVEFMRLLDESAATRGCAGWLEKTPEHFGYLDVIETLCPDARFVHVMRSGEDVVASAVDAEMRFADREAFRGGAAFWVKRWNYAAETHLRFAGQPGHFIVCHEDLVNDHEGTLARLLQFAGLEDTSPRVTLPGEIADLRLEPWKHAALTGGVVPAARKFEAVFGPQAQAWIRERLRPYESLRAEIAARQSALPAAPRPRKLAETIAA